MCLIIVENIACYLTCILEKNWVKPEHCECSHELSLCGWPRANEFVIADVECNL